MLSASRRAACRSSSATSALRLSSWLSIALTLVQSFAAPDVFGRARRTPESGYPKALALLAQLVEHLHGKEGVSGSSPEEGSPKVLQISHRPAVARVACS